MSGATARRAPSRHDAASVSRAFRPGRLAAAFLLAAFSFVLAPHASAQGLSAEDLWIEHVGTDTTAPRIVSVRRTGREGERTSASTLGFEVTFSEPVHVDPGDLEIARSPGSWRRVEKNIGPHYDEQDRLKASRDPYYKPCNPDEDRIYANLGAGAAWDLIERLDDECYRREQLSRHWHVLASGGALVGTIYYEVDLVVAANHDMVDVHGNRLDSTLPAGDAYEGYIIDRQGPSPRMTASATEHDGSTPFTVTVDFRAPVWGFRAGDMRFNADLASVTLSSGSDGASVYVLTVTPLGDADRLIALSLPRGVATDAAGNVNDRGGSVLVTGIPDPGVSLSTRALTVPEGGEATFTVRLTTQPTANVSFALDTATGDVDIVSLTAGLVFTPENWSTRRTYRVSAAEDDDSVNGTKTFDFIVTSTDTDYSGLNVPSLTVTEADNDTTPLSALSLTAGGSAVTLSPGFSADTTSYTALVANDVDTVTVAATAAATGATVSISPADDDTSTSGHQVDLEVGVVKEIRVTVTNAGATRTYTVTVTRLGPPGVTFSTDALSVPEGEAATYTVVLDTQPSANVVIGVVPSTGDHSINNSGAAIFDFTPANWDTPQTITLFALEDDDTLNGVRTIMHIISTTDTAYAALTLPSLTATEVDNDLLSALSLTDAGGTAVTLDQTFAPGTTAYTASAAAVVSTVTVAATPVADATVSIMPADDDTSTSGHQVDLDVGENTITVEVTDGTKSRTYTVTVTRTAVLWSATMTVAEETVNGLGDGFFHSDLPGVDTTLGSLTDRTFDYAPGSETRVAQISISPAGSSVTLQLQPFSGNSLDGYTLHWGGGSGGIGNASSHRFGTRTQFRWDATGTNGFFSGTTAPSVGDTGVQVCITIDGSGCPSGSGTSGTAGAEAPAPEGGVAASFAAVPEAHDGDEFTFEVHFDPAPNTSYRWMRDSVFQVEGGDITRAKRLVRGSNAGWRMTVVPDGDGAVSVTLPPTTECAPPESTICTRDGAMLHLGHGLVVPGPATPAETEPEAPAPVENACAVEAPPAVEAMERAYDATWSVNLPASGDADKHNLRVLLDGREAKVREVGLRYVQNGARLETRTDRASVDLRERLADEPLTFIHRARKTCDGELTTADTRFTVTFLGPPALSVSDAEVREGPGATLDFAVTLDRASDAPISVLAQTADGTATAGADYDAVSRTVTFAAGETVKTVEVPVLDDAHDEGEETMTLVLSNAEGALIDDGEGTGTIVNNDAIPKAWIARFGRTVTGQVLDAVEARLAAPREAGGRMSVAGYAVAAPGGSGGSAGTGGGVQTPAQAAAEDRAAVAALGSWTDGARTGRSQALRERWNDGPEPKSLDITRHALVTGTAFTLTGGSADGGGFASLWGHASVAGFDGREDALSLDGEVTTGFLGADWAAERWTAGLALGHSAGTGGYRDGECEESAPADGAQGCGGRIEAELTGLYPYAGLDVTELVSVWLAGGHSAGELTVIPDGPDGPDGSGAIDTDLSMRMGAGGTRIAVLGSEGGEGFNLALKGDGRFTRTVSDAARGPDGGNLAEAEADVWLLRFGVEGSRPFALGGSGTGDGTGASLTPSFELALRRDGGDAETGFGADMGGGLAVAAPERGLRLDLKGRALVAHEAPGFREWGASAGFGFDPRPSTERGLSVSLTQAYGASPSGGMDALLDRETLAGFAASDTDSGRFEASNRLTGTLGYGLPAFGGGFTGTPNVGFGLSETGRDWRLGWRLTPARPGASGFEVTLDATRRESADADAEHGVALGGRFRW